MKMDQTLNLICIVKSMRISCWLLDNAFWESFTPFLLEFHYIFIDIIFCFVLFSIVSKSSNNYKKIYFWIDIFPLVFHSINRGFYCTTFYSWKLFIFFFKTITGECTSYCWKFLLNSKEHGHQHDFGWWMKILWIMVKRSKLPDKQLNFWYCAASRLIACWKWYHLICIS